MKLHCNNCRKDEEIFCKNSGSQYGAYCKKCGSYIKWLGKKDKIIYEQEEALKGKSLNYSNLVNSNDSSESLCAYCSKEWAIKVDDSLGFVVPLGGIKFCPMCGKKKESVVKESFTTTNESKTDINTDDCPF